MKCSRTILLAALIVGALSASALGQHSFPPPVQSPAIACRDFCKQLYGGDTDKADRCVLGCEEAERCIERCTGRLGSDESKLERCKHRCARGR